MLGDKKINEHEKYESSKKVMFYLVFDMFLFSQKTC